MSMNRIITMLCAAALAAGSALAAGVPVNNPVAQYQLPWTEEIKWGNVVNIHDVKGKTLEARFYAAQQQLAAQGGGVVYFPAGTYRFAENITLQDGVVVRGADPIGVTDARQEGYNPPTKFDFPQYRPRLSGEGTPISTAFKGIYAEDPATTSNCGVVNIAINHGHIAMGDDANHNAGHNRLVYGCVLRNAASAATDVPDLSIGQHPWQRYTAPHTGAINICSTVNALVANNRLPKSGEDDFLMKDYVILDRDKKSLAVKEGVLFDYDSRPGIQVNHYGLGGSGNNPPDGTPELFPWGFRKGTLIRDNYIYCTGRCAIAFSGDGVVCSFNVIRFKPEVVRWTHTGKHITSGSATNDNRAVEMRGWRWTLEGNDYEVYRNRVPNSKVYINDGEGLMHEDHANSTVLDSKLINNKGNAYLSIFATGGIDGLLIKGNTITTPGGIDAIFAVADRTFVGRFPCKNVTIEDNTISVTGIRIAGDPAENNIVRNNRFLGGEGKLVNGAKALVENNPGFTVITYTTEDYEKRRQRK